MQSDAKLKNVSVLRLLVRQRLRECRMSSVGRLKQSGKLLNSVGRPKNGDW